MTKIVIFRTLLIDIWHHNVSSDKQIKQQNFELSFCKLFRIIKSNSSEFLLHSSKTFPKVELFTIFSQSFFGTNFRLQNKNNVLEIISNCIYQLSKKCCLYYVFEHLKYCSQINEYWLNKNAGLNIVLRRLFNGTKGAQSFSIIVCNNFRHVSWSTFWLFIRKPYFLSKRESKCLLRKTGVSVIKRWIAIKSSKRFFQSVDASQNLIVWHFRLQFCLRLSKNCLQTFRR